MENNNLIQKKENVLAGIVGALLFSLAGGALWVVLYQFGYLAGISGLVGVVCAAKGYKIFAKKESLKGIIISIILAVIVMISAWYLCLSLDLYNLYQDWYANGEVNFTITFGQAVKDVYLLFEDSDIAVECFKDLGIGLLLCVVGAFSYVSNAIKRIKQEKEIAQNAQTAPNAQTAENTVEVADTQG